MRPKVFSKRNPATAKTSSLTFPSRNRIWITIRDCDPYYDSDHISSSDLCTDDLPERLKKEHGWIELRAYKNPNEYEVLKSMQEFIQRGTPRFVLDSCELFFDILEEYQVNRGYSGADPVRYQKQLNVIFDDANLPWRMLDGRILKVDSKWLEEEIHAKAIELIAVAGFEGALHEFLQARSDFSNGDFKGAINSANLALESTMKGILGVEQAKPGELVRKIIDSGIIPDYHEEFLVVFEKHILRSVPNARNFEKGVGHGQGVVISEPPKSFAELAVNLTGVLILFLIKRHLELYPPRVDTPNESVDLSDDVPF
ncbi:MAG TPA: abortive infection family protein [Acidobacteriota bacterium]|nr:abortive infection family protein [Acidobacteriota bacterium]